jgi:hypothetical protein
MCRQTLRNEVPEAGKPALSCLPNRACVTVRVLHVFWIICSRSNSASLVLLLHWRISGGASSFLGKGRQPVLVEPRCSLISMRAGSGALLPETRAFDGEFDAVGAPSAERGRSAEIAPEKVKTAAQEGAVEAPQEASALSLRRARGQRSDCSSGVLGHACRSDELQRHGACGVCRSAQSSLDAWRIWRGRLEESGEGMDWRSLLHPSARAQLSSAANRARRKYRITEPAEDRRSNRRRFADEKKQAMMQATEMVRRPRQGG